MSQRSDALTVALTGQLTFILLVSAALAFVASLLILRLYRRAVIQSMQRRSKSEIAVPKGFIPPEPQHKSHEGTLTFAFITRQSTGEDKDAARLYRRAARRRGLVALIQVIAGCCFAATMTAAFLLSSKMAILPFRFLFLTWVNAWPILLTIVLLTGIGRRMTLLGAVLYFIIGATLGAILLDRSPDLTTRQLLYLWLDPNGPSTLLLLAFLNRRIRAVGPLVLVFMILGVTGASLIVTLTGNNQKLVKTVSDFSHSIGLSAMGTMVALHLVGFAAFAVVGWFILGTLRRLYEAKSISEQSIIADAVWLLFGIVNSIQLVFQGPFWILSGLVAFAVYKTAASGLFRVFRLARNAKADGRRLLLLRVFALGKSSEHLYDTLGKSWRTIGSLQMIAGPDLATSAIEPHEFLDFVKGKLDRRFIDSSRTLDLRINQMDLQPDKEGQFRVTEFFCHDDTWKMTLARLADESDAVLMDIRGFSQANTGCIFEIHELFNIVPLSRVVFAIDDTTDLTFMRQTMQQAWRECKDRSPNHRLAAGQVSLVQVPGRGTTGTRNLLHALCGAATTASN